MTRILRLMFGVVLIVLVVLVTRERVHATAGSPVPRPAIAGSYGRLPLAFEANQGQTDRRVQFLSRGNGYSLFLTSTEAVLTLRPRAETSHASSKPRPHAGTTSSRAAVLRMQLLGSNSNAVATGLEELPGRSNYFVGGDSKQWRTNVPNYGKVRFTGVYPGIDLLYYGNRRQLEYDFIVAPGADPAAITLGFQGQHGVRIDANGELAIETGVGEIRWHKPVLYQDVGGVRQRVQGKYARRPGDAIGFDVAAYDRRHPLIIDPELVYSTYLGGTGSDFGTGIAVDAAGNAYVTGFTSSTDFPVTAGTIQTTRAGNPAVSWSTDAFVAKLNATGDALVYATYLGATPGFSCNGSVDTVTSSVSAAAIAVDSSGDAYVTGTSHGIFPTTAGALQVDFCSASAAFVAKLNAAGDALVYSTLLSGHDEASCPDCAANDGQGIAIDSSGNAYVTGRTTAINFPTVNAFQAGLLAGTTQAIFVAKLNAGGSGLLYSTYMGGGLNDYGYGIAVDSSANAYVTGTTQSTLFPTSAGAVQSTLAGFIDAFVTKINTNGAGLASLVYSTYLGGTQFDWGEGIAIDSSGNAYVTGGTESSNFPTTAGAFQATSKSLVSAFVAKLNPTGSALAYSTYLGGSTGDQGDGIAVDASGHAYVTGYTRSTDFPTVDPIQATIGGGLDLFVAELTASGSALQYSTYLGGNGQDWSAGYGANLALDAHNNVYITGQTSSTNFPTTVGAFQSAVAGGGDAFVAKIGVPATGALPPTIAKAFGTTTLPLGNSTSLSFTLQNPNPTALSGVAFTDPLPVGMIVANPPELTGSCGGPVTAVPNSSSIVLTAGSLGGNATCSFSVMITGNSIGTWTNVTGSVTSAESSAGGSATASLMVGPPLPNCQGLLTSAYAQQFGNLANAARLLGYPSVKALQDALRVQCGG